MGLFDLFKKKPKTMDSDVKAELKSDKLDAVSVYQDIEKKLSSIQSAPVEPAFHFELSRETIDLGDTVSRYCFEEILFIDEQTNDIKRYLLEGSNQTIAAKDLEHLIDLLQKTITVQSLNIILQFPTSINYSHQNYPQSPIDFAFILHSPLTKTGKKSKFPFELYLGSSSDGTNGEIYYLQNGNIGKARLWVWFNHRCHTVHYAIKNAELIVTKIETTNAATSEKIVLYHYDA